MARVTTRAPYKVLAEHPPLTAVYPRVQASDLSISALLALVHPQKLEKPRSVTRFFKTVSNSIKESQSHFFSAWKPSFSVSLIL